MQGRTLFIGFFIFLAIFAAGLFYSINFAHYSSANYATHEIAGLEVSNYREIDGTSSPIKFRACFDLPEGTVLYGESDENATPLVAPYWFDCFDAKTLQDDINNEQVRAIAYKNNEPFGTTSYIVVYPDGHAFAWRQLNACGVAYFEGEDLPPECEESETVNG